MKLNLPIVLTGIRILAIPLVVLVYYLDAPWAGPAAGVLFALAGVTDYLDGYLARRLGQTSRFGAFLDPVADKLIVATALVIIVQHDPRIHLAIVAAIIIGREITVSALREWMSEIGASAKVAVSFVAKWKTTVQMVAIAVLLLGPVGEEIFAYTEEVGLTLLWIAAIVTLYTGYDYFRAGFRHLLGQD